jgi:predicted alpha/beta-hydrolase family hydrolase
LSTLRAPDLLVDGPEGARRTLVLAHGAGQGMDSAFMQTMAGLIAQGGVQVVRFEFPYMAERRRTGVKRPPDREAALLDAWLQVLQRMEAAGTPRSAIAIGGKSLGGRMASLLVDEQHLAALVCLGYPFHPPGRPDRRRTAHLEGLRTPTLICQGARDPFGRPAEVEGYRLSPAVRIQWIDDGDHSFRPRKASGLSEEQNLSTAARAVLTFLSGLG